MEVPRIWRLQTKRYGLVGMIDQGGNVSFGEGGSSPKFHLNGNGHHKEEGVLENPKVIYQAPRSSS